LAWWGRASWLTDFLARLPADLPTDLLAGFRTERERRATGINVL